MNKIFVFFFALLLLVSCSDNSHANLKPRMYPKVIYPNKVFYNYISNDCDISFKVPLYYSFVKDSADTNVNGYNPCWINLQLDSLNVTIHCSYHAATSDKDLSSLINDVFKLTSEHNIRASYRKETIIDKKDVKGILFELEGPVASPIQFYLTNEKNHFFRGSLYFNSKVNPDSTAPILTFIKTDIDSLIHSFEWKKM